MRTQAKKSFLLAAGALFVSLWLVLSFAMTAHAATTAKAINNAKIRQEPSTSSTQVGSVESGASLSIERQTTGDDGYTWYEVYVDSSTIGYIRSDLVSITDGTTPTSFTWSAEDTSTTDTASSESTTTATSTTDSGIVITQVNAISATVTGSSAVRVRSDASTTGQILTTAAEGLVVTVTGVATGDDGNTWYQVSFTDSGSSYTGFIRSDYLSLSGDLEEVTISQETTEDATDEETQDDAAESASSATTVNKDYETQLDNDTWYLVDNVESVRYSISEIFAFVDNNGDQIQALEEENQKLTNKNRILLVILVLAIGFLGAAVVFLILKIKDMNDAAYFNQVEQETLQKRKNAKEAGAAAAAAKSQGAQRKQASAQGQAQQRPQSAQSAQRRPQQATGEQRVATQPRSSQSAVSQKTKVVATSQTAQSAQSAQQARQQAAAAQQSKTVQPRSSAAPAAQSAKPVSKPKNFMAEDDDELEFEFLNWDGEE